MSTKRTRRHSPSTAGLRVAARYAIEALERRTLLAVSLSFDDGRVAYDLGVPATATHYGIGKFNSDSQFDVAVQFRDGNGVFSRHVAVGTGGGTFNHASNTTSNAFDSDVYATGNFNGDANVDLYIGTTATNGPRPLRVFKGNGNGVVDANPTGNGVPYAGGGKTMNGFTTADVTGDGRTDIIAVGFAGLFVYSDDGSGNYDTTAFSDTTRNFDRVVNAVDVNGDGRRDLIAVSTGLNEGRRPYVRLAQAGGTFGPATLVPNDQFFLFRYGAPLSQRLGDLNGDGRVDLVIGGPREAYVLLGQGNGNFAYRGKIENLSSYESIA